MSAIAHHARLASFAEQEDTVSAGAS